MTMNEWKVLGTVARAGNVRKVVAVNAGFRQKPDNFTISSVNYRSPDISSAILNDLGPNSTQKAETFEKCLNCVVFHLSLLHNMLKSNKKPYRYFWQKRYRNPKIEIGRLGLRAYKNGLLNRFSSQFCIENVAGLSVCYTHIWATTTHRAAYKTKADDHHAPRSRLRNTNQLPA
jgi:hypothetical protein